MRMVPCKDCQKREVGCHGNCTDYIQWAKEKRDLNNAVKKYKSDSLGGKYFTPNSYLKKLLNCNRNYST